jgi:hypothetical protein
MSIQTEIFNLRERSSLTSTSQEIQSGKLFAVAAERIIEQCGHFSDPIPGQVGIELENIVTDNHGRPVNSDERDRFIATAKTLVTESALPITLQQELGAAQIEINQGIDALFSLDNIEPEVVLAFFKQTEQILSESAEQQRTKLLNLGFHPFADVRNVPRTNKPKYDLVPTHHDGNRLASSRTLQSDLNLLNEPDATVAALTNSLQFNISMPDVPTAIRAMNMMFQITPQILAIGGNAGLAESADTKWSDFRNQIWDKTHRTSAGQRVFLPDDFILSPEDLFLRMARFPLILEAPNPKAAFEIATGTNWLAAKLKFLCNDDLDLNKLLLEFRPLSLQQTPEENAEMFLLTLGRLKLAMETDEPLFDDFDTIRVNGELAQRRGTQLTMVAKKFTGTHWENSMVTGQEIRELEIHHSSLGLSMTSDRNVPMTRYNAIRSFFEKNVGVQNPTVRLRAELGTSWEEGSDSERREHIRDTLIGSGIMR